jgi:hypothetical protein
VVVSKDAPSNIIWLALIFCYCQLKIGSGQTCYMQFVQQFVEWYLVVYDARLWTDLRSLQKHGYHFSGYALMWSHYNSDSGWLRAGERSGRFKNFHFSISSRPAQGPTQPPIQ